MAATAGHKDILVKLIDYVKNKYDQSEAIGKTRESFLCDLKTLWFDQDYLTPLHFAAAKGHKNCLEILYQLSEEVKSLVRLDMILFVIFFIYLFVNMHLCGGGNW